MSTKRIIIKKKSPQQLANLKIEEPAQVNIIDEEPITEEDSDSLYEEDYDKEKIKTLLKDIREETLRKGYEKFLNQENGSIAIPEAGWFYDSYDDEFTKFQIEYLKKHIIPKMTKEQLAEMLYSSYEGYGLANEDIDDIIKVIKTEV